MSINYFGEVYRNVQEAIAYEEVEGRFLFSPLKRKEGACCVCCGGTSFVNLGTMFSFVLRCFLVIIMSPTNKAAQQRGFMIPFLLSRFPFIAVDQMSGGAQR